MTDTSFPAENVALRKKETGVEGDARLSLIYPFWPSVPPSQAPAFFRDLNLDQITSGITAGRTEFRLEEYLWAGPADSETIRFRQAIMKDLEQQETVAPLRRFCGAMAMMRRKQEQLEKFHYAEQKAAWQLAVAELYCGTVTGLADDLATVPIGAGGLIAMRDHLAATVGSGNFPVMFDEARRVRAALQKIRYDFQIRYPEVSVQAAASGDDYGADICRTFDRFRAADVNVKDLVIPGFLEMDQVEANILAGVRQLFPQAFTDLAAFVRTYGQPMDPVIVRFDRELQFYLGYVDYVADLKRAGLPFCYPDVSAATHSVSAQGVCDLALAKKLVASKASVVLNDFALEDGERIFVVSGPNQGGKTTFARMMGQLHYLAALGLPVPGERAKLLLFDRIFTHFERAENIHNLRGKLQDDLVRIHDVLEQATDHSIIVMNEIFTSTTLRDAVFLGTEVLRRVIDTGALAVCVTFIDELSRLGKETVSFVSTVEPDNPASRTFKIVRKRADGMAHAMAIADKYRLTSDALRERLGP